MHFKLGLSVLGVATCPLQISEMTRNGRSNTGARDGPSFLSDKNDSEIMATFCFNVWDFLEAEITLFPREKAQNNTCPRVLALKCAAGMMGVAGSPIPQGGRNPC